MADEIDLAQARDAIHREAALSKLRRCTPASPAPASTGICALCGDPIAPARLAALPHARSCYDCANRTENAARHQHAVGFR